MAPKKTNRIVVKKKPKAARRERARVAEAAVAPAPAAGETARERLVRTARTRPLVEGEMEYREREKVTDYGLCPVCSRPLHVLGGFLCDSCKLGVCEDCIRKYQGTGRYICLSCAAKLPKEEQLKVTGAEDLTNPLPSFGVRTFKWWIALGLLALPVLLGGAWLLYAAGRQMEAVGLIIVLIALLLYWNDESQKWLGSGP